MSAPRHDAVDSAGRPLFLAIALALAAVIPLLGFPVYFRTDDVHWLGWALGHSNPLAAFDPGENLFGYYRPVPTLAWWFLARLFGFEPLGYQSVLAAVAVLAMVPLYRIGRRLIGAEWGGLAAVVLYHALNLTILYYVYWYSALTFALELLLILLAFDALLDGPARPARPRAFLAWGLLAGLAKQPALLLLPLVGGGILLSGPGTRKSRWLWCLGLLLGSVSLLLVTPFVAHRPEALSSMAAPDRLDFLRERFDFYARVLFRGTAGPLVALAAVFGMVGRRDSARPLAVLVALAGGLVAAALIRLAPVPVAAGCWLALILGAALRVPASRPWVAGFLFPVLLLTGVDFHVATYLLEPLLCLVPASLLWVGPALEPIGSRVTAWTRRLPTPLALVMPLVLLGIGVVALRDRVPPIVAMRDVRATFRAGVDHLVREAPQGATIGCLSYDELGSTYADIRRRPLGERVEQHKTMNPAQLEKFLRLRGRTDLSVVPVAEARTRTGPVVLLALNGEEDELLRSIPGIQPRAEFRRGRSAVFVYVLID